MDNATIARIFGEIGVLLEIKGANPFKIRAYRNAADTVLHLGTRVADLSDGDLLALPGIGKDLAARAKEIVETGDAQFHQELLAEFPPTVLDLLRLQGVGPKTVALLHSQMNIRTLDELERAARAGQLRSLRGMGAKKEQLLLKALAEQKRYAGRHLVVNAHEVASTLTAYLHEREPAADLIAVGSLRRGAETCGDIDLLGTGPAGDLMGHFTRHPDAERLLGQGETKSSIMLRGGFQVDLRLVPNESRGAALQYFTGSKAHNIELRDRAIRRGLKLNEYGLFAISDGTRVGGATEEEVYEALGLPFIEPELRENRGEIEAAEADVLPGLIALTDLQGDLHSHTTATDGRADIEEMALAAQSAGLNYLAITDHSKALAMANGLDERGALEHARRIRDIGSRMPGITLLAGLECDIGVDGTLDLSEDCLAELDIVVASVHSAFGLDESQMTDRVLRAIESPVVDVIGHPTGRLILRRDAYRLDVERVVEAAGRHGVALEINSQAHRLDLNEVHARLAKEHGVKMVISTDAHSPSSFSLLRWGVTVARRAWLEPSDVLNTLPVKTLRAALRRNAER